MKITKKLFVINKPHLTNRLILGVNYMCSSGFMLYLQSRFEVWRETLNINEESALLVQNCIGVLDAWTVLNYPIHFTINNHIEQIVLFDSLKTTEMCGISSLILSCIVRGSQLSKQFNILPITVIRVATIGIKVLNNVAYQDLSFFQDIILKYIIEYQHSLRCLMTHLMELYKQDIMDEENEYLIEILLINIGYMSLGNSETQKIFNWGLPPTIIQQLSQLPLKYLIECKYQNILFPTILSICYKNESNLNMLVDELDPEYLIEYLTEIKNGKEISSIFILIY